TAQAKTVPPGDGTDLLHPVAGDVLPQRVVLEAALQGQRHGLGHAGEGFPGRKAEIEVEVHLPGHLDHTAVDHEHVIAGLGHACGDIARAGNVAYDAARLEQLRLDDRFHSTGDGDDDLGIFHL